MKRTSFLIVLESIVAGGAGTAALLYGFPVMLTMGLASLTDSPTVVGFGLIGLLGSAWALAEFWRLALLTAGGSRYEFGVRFWLAILGAGVALVSFWASMPLEALFLFVGLPALAAVHFSILQVMRLQVA